MYLLKTDYRASLQTPNTLTNIIELYRLYEKLVLYMFIEENNIIISYTFCVF